MEDMVVVVVVRVVLAEDKGEAEWRVRELYRRAANSSSLRLPLGRIRGQLSDDLRFGLRSRSPIARFSKTNNRDEQQKARSARRIPSSYIHRRLQPISGYYYDYIHYDCKQNTCAYIGISTTRSPLYGLSTPCTVLVGGPSLSSWCVHSAVHPVPLCWP